MIRRLRFALVFIGVVAVLSVLLSRARFINESVGPVIYRLLLFLWQLLLYIPEFTYWFVFAALSCVIILALLMRLVFDWLIRESDKRARKAMAQKGPVERHADVLKVCESSAFYSQQVARETSALLFQALDRPERTRGDVDDALEGDTLNISRAVRTYLLTGDGTSVLEGEALDETLAEIERALDLPLPEAWR